MVKDRPSPPSIKPQTWFATLVMIVDKYLLFCGLLVAIVGAVEDVRCARIPNWLTYSSLAAAIAIRGGALGWAALIDGMFGTVVLGGGIFIFFFLRAMGGGDLKLAAALGAWVGGAHALPLLLSAFMAGGVLAIASIIFRGDVLRTLLNTVELIGHHLCWGLVPHPVLNIDEPRTMRIPFGLAIAVGALYCVSSTFWWR